jgi:hypothetical protein
MESTSRMTDVERAVMQISEDRVQVSDDSVAEALAREIMAEHIDTLETEAAVEAGIGAAIEEVDDATFEFAVDVIRDRVFAEVEGQAKKIALRMLREAAAKAEQAAAACSPAGGM